MFNFNDRALMLVLSTALATSACGANATVPTGTSQLSAPFGEALVPNDTTSILKKLKKDVVIGSTVDPKNGDMGPRAISVAKSTFGLKKGQLLVCNFEDSSGGAGKGTTIEVLNPKQNSKPSTFTQTSKIAGCDGSAPTAGNAVYGTGLGSGLTAEFNQAGKLLHTYVQNPLADADAFCGFPYAPEDIYVGDAKTGAVIKIEFLEVSRGGKPVVTQVISGFAVNKASGWNALGPSGIQYNATHTSPGKCDDHVYIVDGVNNTIVAISNASNLLVKNEIVVEPGGKKFKCLDAKKTCARLVYSGSPLNAPVASALLPNGNLIVANTKGGNTLVELTPAGKILDTRKIDTNSTADVFGLLAQGTSDSDTVLYYTDTKTNTLHELEQ